MDNIAEVAPPHKRAHKACASCRARKAKCDLGDRDGPPCIRCRRELRECIFRAERSTKKRQLDARGRSLPINAGTAADPSLSPPSREDMTLDDHVLNLPIVHSHSHNDEQALINAGVLPHGTPSRLLQGPVPNLAKSVRSTVVANNNDALHLLFQAAAHGRDGFSSDSPCHAEFDGTSTLASQVAHSEAFPAGPVEDAARKVWGTSVFVSKGWFSADEAISYLDVFFKEMNPLSPVLTDHYAVPSNHRQLLQEPLLCCTLLMIASRHHKLPGAGGASRSFYIHDRLWKLCQHLVMKLIFDQDKSSDIRTIGSIEALLLISEWHPRSLHFASDLDAWDTTLIAGDSTDHESRNQQTPTDRWLADVVDPARRSDRMSWMLLGCALSLAHELTIFRDQQQPGTRLDFTTSRNNRASTLLYVFTNQLASRTGISSTLPQNVTRGPRRDGFDMGHWNTHMRAWTELTKLFKSLTDMAFASKDITEQLLRSGRYIGLLQHFQPLLEQWRTHYLEDQDFPPVYRDVLFIEYQYVRIYCNSIGMQAVCERAINTEADGNKLSGFALPFEVADQEYIQEVVSGSCDILEKIIELADRDKLRFAPVRIFLRLTTSSVFLLKAMSIGIRNVQLRFALSVLHRCVKALRSSVSDDMHLANSFAELLEVHIKQIQSGFLLSSQRVSPGQVNVSARLSTRDSTGNTVTTPARAEDGHIGRDEDTDSFALNLDDLLAGDDWLSLPFDPSMAPFASNYTSTLPSNLQNDGLDFLWNFPAGV